MRCSLAAVVTATALLCPLGAAARTTVAVAPLSTTSGQEYKWIGAAISSALALRVHQQHELNALTPRQVNAAMRHDNVDAQSVTNLDVAVQLGRQLGADILVAGTYTAAWPDIEMVIKVFDPQRKKLVSPTILSGGLDDLFDVEARVANALALALGAEKPDITPAAFGSDNLRSWRLTTLAHGILDWQSLSPRAADPAAPLRLPKTAIKKARRYLEEAIRYDANYGDAWAGLGVCQALVGDTDAAWKSFGKATASGAGDHPTAVLGSSFVRLRAGKLGQGERILVNAIARHPGFLHARGYLGELYIHTGRYKEALAVFDDYAAIVPHQPWVLAQRGYVKAKLKDYPGAIADSTAAVDIAPTSPYMMLELASRYIDAHKLMGAEDTLERAIDKHPGNSTAYVRLGYVYLLQGKDDLVVPITEQALANADFGKRLRDRGYAHLNLVRAYAHQGDLDRALEHLAEAKATGVIAVSALNDELGADPKLATLRKDPRFAKLMR